MVGRGNRIRSAFLRLHIREAQSLRLPKHADSTTILAGPHFNQVSGKLYLRQAEG
jgi:hypothetical protein